MRGIRFQKVIFLTLILTSISALLHAQNQRFDIQPWRPTPAPRDLIIVPQTQPIANASLSAGAYLSFAVAPLSLLNSLQGETTLEIIKSRLELDVMASVGIKDWVEVGMVMPFILFQQSGGDLQATGRNGTLQTIAQGDLSLMAKVAMLRRLPYASGFGAAVLFRTNFPTGIQNAFTSDGAFTYNPSLAFDYRFDFGMLIATQLGVLIRPQQEFFETIVGPTFTGSLGIELPIIRNWGLGMLGGVYFNVPWTDPDLSINKIPAEAMLGLRWYSQLGVTFTTGLTLGMDCGFGIPQFRFFAAAVFVPPKSAEKKAIDNFKRPPDDPDFDGVIGKEDLCPNQAGPVENKGCPPTDSDGDGLPDHLDACPFLHGQRKWAGCPLVYTDGSQIKTAIPFAFESNAPGQLKSTMSELLEKLSQLIIMHPEWPTLVVLGTWDPTLPSEQQKTRSGIQAQALCDQLVKRGVPMNRLMAQARSPILNPQSPAQTEKGIELSLAPPTPLLALPIGPTPLPPQESSP